MRLIIGPVMIETTQQKCYLAFRITLADRFAFTTTYHRSPRWHAAAVSRRLRAANQTLTAEAERYANQSRPFPG